MKTIYTFAIATLLSLFGFNISAQHVLPVRFTLEGDNNFSNSSWDAGDLDKKARVGFQVGMIL